MKTTHQHEIRLANSKDLAQLLPLIRAYHEFEDVALTDAERAAAVSPLLTDPALGRVWIITSQNRPVGYMAVHLEVQRANVRAKSLYAESGFRTRQQFHLMTRAL